MTQFLRTPALLKVASLLAPATRTASANGTGIDLTDYEGSMAAILDYTAGGSGATMDVKLQDCATVGGTYADIAGAAFTQAGNAAGQQIISFDVQAARAFVRAVVTIGGTASFISNLSLVGLKKTQ